ncbi:IclR family transcriptional regulator [Candidatus Haliotispira prima]|uniref:IclR family transcriptional regulator n=1 Tax=Candidatus Haliotispira prima TaxID=3034016 RepID=A0ABY8MDP5_9SPIO|nr:IclR family transcriptional regulator [Candidatus Haliotispira prima]
MNPREILLLDQVLEMEEAPTFTDLRNSSGLSKSTVHRCLNSLEESRLLYRREGRFYPGARLLRWLHLPAAKGNVWTNLLHPYLQQCSRQFGEVVHLVQRQGWKATYIDKVEGLGPIVLRSRIGAELDLYRTAAGLAILARLSNAELERYLESAEGHYTKAELAALRSFPLEAELEATRTRGYSLEIEQNEKNIQCCGVSLGDVHPDLALSVSTTTLLSPDSLHEIGQGLCRVAENISRELL